jgi:hypothetical protein
MRFQLVDALQRTGGFGGRADMLAQAYTYYRDANWVNTRLAAIDRVTLPTCRRWPRERLVPNNRVVLVYVPNRAPAAQPQTPGKAMNRLRTIATWRRPPRAPRPPPPRSTAPPRPPPGPLRPFTVPQPQEFTLANGVRVVVVPQARSPSWTAASWCGGLGVRARRQERAGAAHREPAGPGRAGDDGVAAGRAHGAAGRAVQHQRRLRHRLRRRDRAQGRVRRGDGRWPRAR